jgi:hypothetical protein
MSSAAKGAVYIDEKWLLMRWDSEHECLFAEWKGFATSAEFQGALLKAVDVIREKNGAGFVNDTRKLELVSDDDQRWLMSTWPPLVVGAGLRRLAIVIAKTGLSKMAIQDMLKASPNLFRAVRVPTTRPSSRAHSTPWPMLCGG